MATVVAPRGDASSVVDARRTCRVHDEKMSIEEPKRGAVDPDVLDTGRSGLGRVVGQIHRRQIHVGAPIDARWHNLVQ